MPPVRHLLPDDVQQPGERDPADRNLLNHALAMLPQEEHQRILTDYVLTARRCDVTRDYAPLRRLNDSLFMTARLHASEEYRAAVQKALAEPVGRPMDGQEFLELLRAQRP